MVSKRATREASFEPRGTPGDPQGSTVLVRKLDLAEHRASRLPVGDYRVQSNTAKGTCEAEQMDSFQQARLAAAVVAEEDVDARGGGQRHRVQIANPGDGEAAEGH